MSPQTNKTALIADDEGLARQRLKALLTELGYQISGEAANGDEALQSCRHSPPDIALLDIQMPGMNGLEVARALNHLDHPPAVIFTTAFDQYGLPAFESNAIDYLLKPIRRDRLEQALDKASRFQPVEAANEDPLHGGRQCIYAQYQGNLHLIPIEEVIYFRAEHKYITVRHQKGETLIEDSLKNLSAIYPALFLRVHRNALVAKASILALEKNITGTYCLRLKGVDETVEVSRRHVSHVRNEMKRL